LSSQVEAKTWICVKSIAVKFQWVLGHDFKEPEFRSSNGGGTSVDNSLHASSGEVLVANIEGVQIGDPVGFVGQWDIAEWGGVEAWVNTSQNQSAADIGVLGKEE